MKHKHHIIPRHLGGSNDPSNLVELSIEEHAEAHKQLWLMDHRWQDELAYLTLSGQITQAQVIKEAQRNSWLGKKLTPEHKAKLSAAKKDVYNGSKNPNFGKPRSQEIKDKISQKLCGRKHSEEMKQKIRNGMIGKPCGRPKKVVI